MSYAEIVQGSPIFSRNQPPENWSDDYSRPTTIVVRPVLLARRAAAQRQLLISTRTKPNLAAAQRQLFIFAVTKPNLAAAQRHLLSSRWREIDEATAQRHLFLTEDCTFPHIFNLKDVAALQLNNFQHNMLRRTNPDGVKVISTPKRPLKLIII